MILIALVILALAGGILLGGIFTIVLIPIAAIVVVSAFAYAATARKAERQESSGSARPPLPHTPQRDSGHVATSPEALADARRTQQ